MDYKEFVLDLYKKGCTPKYIANLLCRKLKKRNSIATHYQALALVENTILEFCTTKRT